MKIKIDTIAMIQAYSGILLLTIVDILRIYYGKGIF